MDGAPEKFLKPYDPAATESRLYKEWEESGYFNPDNLPATAHAPAGPQRKPFTIMMPPPNATGVLHMGHALGLTIQDIVTRFERMRGKAALWLPGTDHAAIATQSVVEKELSKKEGKSRHDLGREAMLARISEFVEQSRGTIRAQIRAMGASADWSREAFTLDAPRNRAVNVLFKKMYDAGLIYRGYRIVNWDPKGQTTISDDEIVHDERAGKLYTFRYDKGFPIPIATTRPETKLGDTAVAVSPNDTRYAAYVGQTFAVDFMGEKLSIRVIADESVDPAFGTGALGVTPAHSLVDWEMKDRHALKVIQVIDERGRMMLGDESVKGKKIAEAREIIVQSLRDQGLLEKEEDIKQGIATAERTGGIIEPLPKLQWFVDVDKKFTMPHSEIPGIASGSETTLKDMMRAAVAGGGVQVIPDYLEKTYFHWIDNLRPWCISRQIWYGHRVPVWYRGEEVAIGEAPADAETGGWTQDEDTLDTWFSSGAWTFTTLGWPDATADLARFHPTNLLETGHDILFFWIARMILMTGFALGQVPFRTAYLHGLVRDAKGQKFSKSLGNGIDPIVIVQKYGADAARMALVVGNTPGTDLKLAEDRIKGYKHFANKLWNIARFVLENARAGGQETFSAGVAGLSAQREGVLSATDRGLMDEFNALAEDVTKDLEEYRVYMAAEKLYHYAWHRLADEILEESKPLFRPENNADPVARASRAQALLAILDNLMRALHPFMPFVTEEIWRSLPGNAGAVLMVADWPVQAAVE